VFCFQCTVGEGFQSRLNRAAQRLFAVRYRFPGLANRAERRIPVPRYVTKGRSDGRGSERTVAARPARSGSACECAGRAAVRARALRLAASLVLLLCSAGVVFGWWLWNIAQVRTTNAYVVGNITPVSSDVGGQVVALYADDNMIVAAGDPLAQLDPVPFQLEV